MTACVLNPYPPGPFPNEQSSRCLNVSRNLQLKDTDHFSQLTRDREERNIDI